MTSDPAAASASLRALALSQAPAEIGFAQSTSGKTVFGALMETGLERAVVTLVCFYDGTTSLYFSTGGGVIGCGEHEAVKVAARTFIAIAGKYADRFPPTAEYPLPEKGHVRFYLRTPSATLTSSAAERELRDKQDAMWPLYYSGNHVITAIRTLGLL